MILEDYFADYTVTDTYADLYRLVKHGTFSIILGTLLIYGTVLVEELADPAVNADLEQLQLISLYAMGLYVLLPTLLYGGRAIFGGAFATWEIATNMGETA